MNVAKKIPYGQTNFEKIRTENHFYVDKTRFIEQLENESTDFHFLIRPRKFGKSLFLSVLDHYYDVRFAEKFDQLFGDLYIGQNPTPKKNSLFVLNLDFSGLDTSSIKRFNISLLGKMKMAVFAYITDHRAFVKDMDAAKAEVWSMENASDCIEYAFDIARSNGKKVYVIIDEYDHFANDMIASDTYLGDEIYRKTVWAGSQIRDVYETLKANSKAIIDTMFITGITPIMLDDLTSGFNISNNISLDYRYSEILGFTENEVQQLIDACGIDRSKITVDLKFLYNGFLFHEDAENKLYNPAMILYLVHQVSITQGKLKRLIDDNLKTDYGRIQMLLQKQGNLTDLEKIIDAGYVQEEVISRFSIEKITEPKNFVSLLYYMGLVTIGRDDKTGLPVLKVPNYSSKTIYWEYMENMIMERNPEMLYKPHIIMEGLSKMAFEGHYKLFFDNFLKNFVSQVSNIDLENFSEKNIKFLLLSILFQNNLYLPISETENSKGYSDIYLQRRSYLYPGIQTDWVWELKYISQKNAGNANLIEEKKAAAKEQLQRYRTSNLFKDRTDVRYLMIVFIGKSDYLIEELIR